MTSIELPSREDPVIDVDPHSPDFIESVDELDAYIGEAATRVAHNNDGHAVEALETLSLEAAEIARQVPNIAAHVAPTLTHAVETLVEYAPDDYRRARTVAEVAGNIHSAVGDDAEGLVQLAEQAIDEHFGGLSNDELGIIINDETAGAHKAAIRETNEHTPYAAALTENVAVAYEGISGKPTALDTFREIRGTEKNGRIANFERRRQEQNFELQHTGAMGAEDYDEPTEPLDDIPSLFRAEIMNPAPDHNDTVAWEAWKQRLRKEMTTKVFIRVAQFNTYDRLVTSEEIARLTSEARDAAA